MELELRCGIDFLPESHYPEWFTHDAIRLKRVATAAVDAPTLPAIHWVAREAVFKSLSPEVQRKKGAFQRISLKWHAVDENRGQWSFITTGNRLNRQGEVHVANNGIIGLAWPVDEISPQWGNIKEFPADIQILSADPGRRWQKLGKSGWLSISHEYGSTFWAAYLPIV